ncbi:hypothetical protein NL676_019656 [Syzygium grande]|nr:hypothetical protein NL676_019656 [Syzygium grande]
MMSFATLAYGLLLMALVFHNTIKSFGAKASKEYLSRSNSLQDPPVAVVGCALNARNKPTGGGSPLDGGDGH